MVPGMPTRPDPRVGEPSREPVRGNAADGLSELLASLGITDTGTRDGVEDTVVAELTRRGFSARVRDLRWGTLTLAASPQEAQLLRFDEDALLAALQDSHPGAVKVLRVVVSRR